MKRPVSIDRLLKRFGYVREEPPLRLVVRLVRPDSNLKLLECRVDYLEMATKLNGRPSDLLQTSGGDIVTIGAYRW